MPTLSRGNPRIPVCFSGVRQAYVPASLSQWHRSLCVFCFFLLSLVMLVLFDVVITPPEMAVTVFLLEGGTFSWPSIPPRISLPFIAFASEMNRALPSSFFIFFFLSILPFCDLVGNRVGNRGPVCSRGRGRPYRRSQSSL